MNNTQVSLVGTAGVIIGAGISKLDTPLLGLGLVTYGVVLVLLVAWLQKKGLEVQASNLG